VAHEPASWEPSAPDRRPVSAGRREILGQAPRPARIGAYGKHGHSRRASSERCELRGHGHDERGGVSRGGTECGVTQRATDDDVPSGAPPGRTSVTEGKRNIERDSCRQVQIEYLLSWTQPISRSRALRSSGSGGLRPRSHPGSLVSRAHGFGGRQLLWAPSCGSMLSRPAPGQMGGWCPGHGQKERRPFPRARARWPSAVLLDAACFEVVAGLDCGPGGGRASGRMTGDRGQGVVRPGSCPALRRPALAAVDSQRPRSKLLDHSRGQDGPQANELGHLLRRQAGVTIEAAGNTSGLRDTP
jgi:hypothetical protein